MRYIHHLFMLAFVLCAVQWPTSASARDRDANYPRSERRYYDRGHRDYHEWNDREAHAWHRYWSERRASEITWERANERQREAYWRWRHKHTNYQIK